MKRLHKHNIPALRASRIAGLAIGVPLHQLTSGRPASSLPRLRGLCPLDASTRHGLTPCLRSPHFARLGWPLHRVKCPQQQYWSARKYLHVLFIASKKRPLEAIPARPSRVSSGPPPRENGDYLPEAMKFMRHRRLIQQLPSNYPGDSSKRSHVRRI